MTPAVHGVLMPIMGYADASLVVGTGVPDCPKHNVSCLDFYLSFIQISRSHVEQFPVHADVIIISSSSKSSINILLMGFPDKAFSISFFNLFCWLFFIFS